MVSCLTLQELIIKYKLYGCDRVATISYNHIFPMTRSHIDIYTTALLIICVLLIDLFFITQQF